LDKAVRHARPTCEECVRLAADCAALFQEYLDARDALALTPKNDRAYLEMRKRLDKVKGQLREARKRDSYHEGTHQDEFSN
jgi:hypothetical protein